MQHLCDTAFWCRDGAGKLAKVASIAKVRSGSHRQVSAQQNGLRHPSVQASHDGSAAAHDAAMQAHVQQHALDMTHGSGQLHSHGMQPAGAPFQQAYAHMPKGDAGWFPQQMQGDVYMYDQPVHSVSGSDQAAMLAQQQAWQQQHMQQQYWQQLQWQQQQQRQQYQGLHYAHYNGWQGL